jgi:cell division protein FtsB
VTVPRRAAGSRPVEGTQGRRRSVLVVGAGVVTGGVILAAWLPVGALLTQHAQLQTASARLAQLAVEQQALTREALRLATPAAQDQLAREQYQLVAPGQRLIQVLTPGFTPSARSTGGPYPGDPGYAPLADPDGVTGASGVTTTTQPRATARAAGGAASSSASAGFYSRLLATLEFWR